MKKVTIVIPCYNEMENIRPLIERLTDCLSKNYQYELLFVDDGSIDKTLQIIKEETLINPNIHFISFSRNFGHQYALKAGIDHAVCDCLISIDADLQHPPELINRMLSFWEEGVDVVYTIRAEDNNLTFLKRKTASVFYTLFNYFTNLNLEEGTADFRLLDKKVVEVLREDINEYELFLRGMIKWVGFKQVAIEYTPNPRYAGESKYTLKKMINFALEGIASFSPRPIKSAIYLGFLISFASFFYGAYAIVGYFFLNVNLSGWTSIITSVLFIGGIQLIFLGILGEYLGRVYLEVKGRPKYIIKEKTKLKND